MTEKAEQLNKVRVKPFALQDEPALIERVFPSQKISAEAQKERKAVQGQTLTALGSYWKGRKPLIMVRAIILGSLLPSTGDTERDLAIFEQLMAIDDAAFARREPNLKASEVAGRVNLEKPWNFFDYSVKGNQVDPEKVKQLRFPIDLSTYPGLTIRWCRNIDQGDKDALLNEAMQNMTYEEKVRLCKRPEQIDLQRLYGPVWPAVNAHLGHLGVEAYSFEQLIEQLGILRYGKRPQVGDTFCGAGSVPFEAARIGCDVFASDLNPIACMLTWGAINIIGASLERRAKIKTGYNRITEAVNQEINELGIEHNNQGDRAKAFLYCLETKCPQTGWMVPMAPSWVISKARKVIVRLHPNYKRKCFDIEIADEVSNAELKAAEQGTVQNEQLVYELDGQTYRTPIRTIRGDYRDNEGNTRNQLRQWEKHDFKPRPSDIFQERLYCIQWITRETLGSTRPETYFASVTEEDLEREKKVEEIVEQNLARWQEEGLVPDMPIEPGDNTDQPIRERGWRYWHQLFNARQLFLGAKIREKSKDPAIILEFCRWLANNNKLCRWTPSSINSRGEGLNADRISQVFYNQALNTLYNYGARSFVYQDSEEWKKIPIQNNKKFITNDIQQVKKSEIFCTDPPYADAINYHEITEFFIAWLRKNPPPPFDQWTWDSRRSLAIQGTGEDFRRSMVEAYSAMAKHMPDNGLQCVMFTHKDPGVWGDMVSIFWAAGLQVVGAWYIATEATTALRDGAHVQGTVLLMLRKRREGGPIFRQQLLPMIRREVSHQVDEMMHLNETARAHGHAIFNDADLQMAAYAAALKVLTGYTEFDGQDVTSLALQPRNRREETVVDEIVRYARQVANDYLIPERLKELNPETWREELASPERYYLRLLAIEQSGQFKLENHQNFAKAFQIDSTPLMASRSANDARLKGASDFRPIELMEGMLGGTVLGNVLIAIQELLQEREPKTVIDQMKSTMDADFYRKTEHLIAVAQYIADMLGSRRPEEARMAEIVANRIYNIRL